MLRKEQGDTAEELFQRSMIAIGKPVVKSTKTQDMFSHIDFIGLDGKTYDVKSEKRLNFRDENTDSKVIWLERNNVNGDPGWLYGKVDKIAFQSSNEFIIVDRQKLLDFINGFILDKDNYYYRKEYRKWYTRERTTSFKSGRAYKDIVTFVYRKDIEHLVEEKINLVN